MSSPDSSPASRIHAARVPPTAGLQRRVCARLATLLTILCLTGFASAQSVVIHPFGGQDLGLGALVAERAANALGEVGVDVYGPDVAPALIPPLVVPNGFLNPVAFLGPAGIDGPTGAEILGQTLGADLAATGTVLFRDGMLVLELNVWDARGEVSILHFDAPEDAPEQLANSAARALARRVGAPAPTAVAPFELTSGFGAYARALTLVGAGFVAQARDELREADDLPDAASELLADLESALGDGVAADPVRSAVYSLASDAFDAEDTVARFERFAAARNLPAAELWIAVLAASTGDTDRASAAFEDATPGYAYARASAASFVQASNLDAVDIDGVIDALDPATDAASWLTLAVMAGNAGDLEAEKRALQRLAREAPFFTYPFERLSFIAFDQDDALAAAEALVVAVELEPDSDLYWTNLGWAYYLLGFLERSEVASEQAIALDPTQFIAHYNLGLAHAVRDDLDAAIPAYDQALQFDPAVDEAAIEDLENALELYPEIPAVHFALGYLYAADGRRADAADQYEAYLAAGEAGAELAPSFARRASRQLEALTAPAAALEISSGASIVLGASGEPAAPYHPGDPLTPVFELFTPGDALPQRVAVTLRVLAQDGSAVASTETEVAVPTGAIGLVVDDLRIELPHNLSAGSYRLEITAEAAEDRVAHEVLEIAVEGEPVALRWLLGRGVVMQALDSGAPLYTVRDLVRADRLPDILLEELRAGADAAADAIPSITAGRFEGLGGGDVFRESTLQDVRDYLAYLQAQGTADRSFVFVESYAQWAVEGAPAP